jgi:hypothetical protein
LNLHLMAWLRLNRFTGPVNELVFTTASIQRVLPRPADKKIVPLTAPEGVITPPSERPIISSTGIDRVIPAVAEEHIVAVATENRVVSTRAVDDVVSGARTQQIFSAFARDHVVSITTVDAVVRYPYRNIVSSRTLCLSRRPGEHTGIGIDDRTSRPWLTTARGISPPPCTRWVGATVRVVPAGPLMAGMPPM